MEMRVKVDRNGLDDGINWGNYIKMQLDDFLAFPARLFGFTYH